MSPTTPDRAECILLGKKKQNIIYYSIYSDKEFVSSLLSDLKRVIRTSAKFQKLGSYYHWYLQGVGDQKTKIGAAVTPLKLHPLYPRCLYLKREDSVCKIMANPLTFLTPPGVLCCYDYYGSLLDI